MMPPFHANTAIQIPDSQKFAPNVSYLYKAFEQSEEELVISRLNHTLASQSGNEFSLSFYAGDQISEIPEDVLLSLADCYAQVFNESWNESWTVDSALAEIKSCLQCPDDYTPAISLMFKGEKVIGFSWGFIMDAESLSDGSAPFSSSSLKRHESVSVARYWLNVIGKKSRLLSIRELGVLKEYRQDKTPYLTVPLFEKAISMNCNVAFLRTKVSSKAFKWCIGVGFIPLQWFMVDGLLLMQGNIKYAMKMGYGMIDAIKKRRTQGEMISNIKRYLCQ